LIHYQKKRPFDNFLHILKKVGSVVNVC